MHHTRPHTAISNPTAPHKQTPLNAFNNTEDSSSSSSSSSLSEASQCGWCGQAITDRHVIKVMMIIKIIIWSDDDNDKDGDGADNDDSDDDDGGS